MKRSPLTLLVVEDEVLARLDTVDVLTKAGYDVRESGCAGEAVALLQDGIAIDGLVTDVEMPGAVDGLELAHVVRDQYPSMAVIIVSGRDLATLAELPAGAKFIGKPLDHAVILDLLTEMLGGREDI